MIVVACGGWPCVFRRSDNQARFECLASMIRTPGSSSSVGQCSLGNARFLAVCRDHKKVLVFPQFSWVFSDQIVVLLLLLSIRRVGHSTDRLHVMRLLLRSFDLDCCANRLLGLHF